MTQPFIKKVWLEKDGARINHGRSSCDFRNPVNVTVGLFLRELYCFKKVGEMWTCKSAWNGQSPNGFVTCMHIVLGFGAVACRNNLMVGIRSILISAISSEQTPNHFVFEVFLNDKVISDASLNHCYSFSCTFILVCMWCWFYFGNKNNTSHWVGRRSSLKSKAFIWLLET